MRNPLPKHPSHMDGGEGASAAASRGAVDHHNNRSPPPPAASQSQSQSQSKRDRKRQALADRLASKTDKWSRDRDLTYRDQLQKIQYEIGLAQGFDPYDPNALDKAAELLAEHRRAQGRPVNAENARSLLDMAGQRFPDFMDELEDLIEMRDYQLAQSKADYDFKCHQYNNVHAYKVETAKREHASLTETLRDRLLNTLSSKRNRLTKEKEVFEINDSNALLLNPSQFSIAIPASPGGMPGKRATRMRKDVEDTNVFPDGKKRKRNPGEDDGSPAPNRRAIDPNSTTPMWQSEKARAAAKQSGPLYSIDKLFTDKELSMHYGTAAQAAHTHILRNRPVGGGDGGGRGSSSSSPSPKDSDDGANGNNGYNSLDNDKDDADSQPPSAPAPAPAPAMERQVSHATRSTRAGAGGGGGSGGGGAGQNLLDDKIIGIEGLSSFSVPANLDRMFAQEAPKMPPLVPQQYLKPYSRNPDHYGPGSLSPVDVTSDLAVMGYFKQHGQMHRPGAHLDGPTGIRKVLQAVSVPYAKNSFVAFTNAPRESPDKLREALGIPPQDPGPGGEQQQQQQQPATAALSLATLSAAGAGGAPMSRATSSQGGVAMSRTGTNGSTRGKKRS